MQQWLKKHQKKVGRDPCNTTHFYINQFGQFQICIDTVLIITPGQVVLIMQNKDILKRMLITVSNFVKALNIAIRLEIYTGSGR